MPIFEITAPTGEKYRITGPDGSTEAEALHRLQQQLAGQQEAPVTAGGIAKAVGSGLQSGVAALAGLPGDVSQLIGTGLRKLPTLVGGAEIPEQSAPSILPTSGQVEKGIQAVTGLEHKPENTAERYAASIASMAPAIAGGPGGLVRRAITQVAIPGAAAEAAGSIPGVKGTALEPVARGAAALLSPIAAERAITPITTAPTRVQAVQTLRNEGVDVSAGQSTGSKFLRKQEEELGGSTTENLAERQAEQFTAAALRRTGTDAPRATADVVDSAFDRIGGQMNQLAANNALLADRQMVRELQQARNGYERLTAPNQRAPVVQDTIDDLLHQFQRGHVTPGGAEPIFALGGDVYQSLRSQLGADARRATNDPHLQRALYGIQNAIDDAMERSIAAQNPQMLGQWQEARRQYRNLLTIEKALSYAGEAANAGFVTPPNLARAVKSMSGGKRDYSRGRGDLAPLARAGAEVMTPLANSNTASRLRTHIFLSSLGAALGGGAGAALGPHGLLGGAVFGAALPRMTGEALVRGRRYLGNTALQNRQTLGSNLTRAVLGAAR